MSLKDAVAQILTDHRYVAFRPSQTYLVAAPGPAYTIFTITNGAIEAVALIGRITAAAVGATTINITANAVAAAAGAVACNGAVGTIVYCGLNVADAILNAAAAPKTIATGSIMYVGTQPAGPGLVVATYGVGTSLTMEWALVYRKLNPSVVVS